MKARDIMTSNPEVVTMDEPISEAARMMRELSIGAVPVVEDRSATHLVSLHAHPWIAVAPYPRVIKPAVARVGAAVAPLSNGTAAVGIPRDQPGSTAGAPDARRRPTH